MAPTNPILPGFHPDPSFCRVDGTYYIATSTFTWFPGVEINASTDLETWTLAARPLDRASQLDMRGNPENCGVWAPSLSHADGLFWLIYTDVKRSENTHKDAHNYLVTAPAINGPWSDPVYLNSSGFDPSLFHDRDGRKWLINMIWDWRGTTATSNRPNGLFGGILLQEYDHSAQRLTGPITNIYKGTERGLVEAPHIFRRDGWYYLITAEGGTGYDHAVTHARSRSLTGPYEVHPDTHPLTQTDPTAQMQRIGHGQFVTGDGEDVWHSFLCGRPLPGLARCPLGRETGIARCRWDDDGWLRVVEWPEVAADGYSDDSQKYDFADGLPGDFQWPRSPEPDRLFSTTARPGWLRLTGRESIGSWFEQSLIARRQTGWRYSAEVLLDYAPRDPLSMAGLTAYYNRYQFHYLCLTRDDAGRRVLDIQSCAGNWPDPVIDRPLGSGLPVPDGPLRLGVDVDLAELQFRWATPEGNWQSIGPALDASALSDEAGQGEHANFTGAFVGMAAQDHTGQALQADFTEFRYENRQGAQK